MKSLILTRHDREGRESGERHSDLERERKKDWGAKSSVTHPNKEHYSQLRSHTVCSQTPGNQPLPEPRAPQNNI